jgi:competence protein ComEC
LRPPILVLAAAFGAGLWAALGGWGGWESVVMLAAGAAVAARAAPVAAAAAVGALAGWLWGGAAVRELGAGCAARWSREAGSHAAIVVLRDPVAGGGVVDAGARGPGCRGDLRVRWPAGREARGGTRWIVAGVWRGDAQRGVLAARRVRLLDPDPSGRGGWRDAVARRSAQLFGSRAPLVDALILNRRADLDPALRDRYARSGLTHLLSISGLHVGFLAAWVVLLLRRLPLAPAAQTAVALALVIGYVWMLGSPAPALRAALMLAIAEVARWQQRVVAPRGSIALAAGLVTLLDPWAVRSVGAWLSVTAIAAVIWADRRFARAHPAVRLVAPSVVATLLTAPITALAFGTVAPIGVLANLAGIPLGALAVPGVALAITTSTVWPAAAELLAAGAGACLALLDVVAAVAGGVPGGHVVTAPGWAPAAAWTGVGLISWWLWQAPRRRGVRAARLAFLAAGASWTLVLARFPSDRDGALTVHFLDVGQGDAAVLRTPHGRWVVIDAGPRTPEGDAGRRVVVPFLRRHGARRVDLVVASHGHADHVGGLPALFEALPVELVLDPGEPVPEAAYLAYLAAVDGAGARWRRARAGDVVEVDGVRIEVLSPDSAWAERTLDPNEESVVLLVRFGRHRLLFTGDAGEPVERRLAGRVGGVDVLKVGHHGSRTATGAAWLAELRPETAVISVGRKNRYGHPAPEVLERLTAAGVRVARTDAAGTATLTFTMDEDRGHRDIRLHP